MKKIFTLIAGAMLAFSASADVWVTPEEAPEAGSVIVDNELMKASTVYGTKTAADAVTLAGQEFGYRMQVRVAAWPTADDLNGTDNGGSTPIVIEVKKPIEITFAFRRQAVSSEYNAGDGKDIAVFSHPDATRVAGEMVEVNDLDGSYGNCTEKFSLPVGTYTVAAKGTTLGLFGFVYEAVGSDPSGDTSSLIYSWEAPEGTVEQVGGTATAKVDEARVNYKNTAKDVDYWTICLSGKKATYPESAYVNITLDQPLAEGDLISVTAFRNKDASGKNVTIEFIFGDNVATLTSTEQFPNLNVDGENDDAPATQTFTVPAAAAGCTSFDMTRNAASTNLFITKLTITREGGDTPAPAEGETMSVFGNGSGIFNKEFESYVTPFEFNAADNQLTLKNFLGGETTVVLDFKIHASTMKPNEVGTVYDAVAVSGLGEEELIQNYYHMCPINGFNGSFILKQNGENVGKLDNIKLAVGGATNYEIKKDTSDDPGYYFFTIFFGGDYSKWNAETSSWDASGSNYVRFEYKLPISGNTSIDEVVADFDENAPVEYYNLQGVRVAEPSNGIFIKRQGNKVVKVLVK